MTDSHLRVLERRFRLSGGVLDEAVWLKARVQAGALDQSQLDLAAYLGHPAAGATPGAPDLTWTPENQAPTWRWAKGLARWGVEVQIRAAVAATRQALAFWEQGHPSARRPHVAVELAERWILSSAAVNLDQLAQAYESARALGESLSSGSRGKVAWAAACCALTPPGSSHVYCEAVYAADEVTDGVAARVRDELVPWALGYSDPVRERVEARQREAAGE